MKSRLKTLRKALSLNQAEFGARLKLARATIAAYEVGNSIPSNRTVADICREFNVNEEWLRTGNGMMFKQQLNLASASMLSADVARLIMSSDDFTKRLVHTYLSLPDEAKQAVAEFLKKVVSEPEEN